MKYKQFGNIGLNLSILGFGSMRLPTVQIGGKDYVDFDKAVEVMHRAFDLGVNYIDSGFLYCSEESEIAVGMALKGYRDKVTLTTKATKFRMESPGDLRRMAEHQLRRLGVDYFDFYCFHGIGYDNFFEIDRRTGWIDDMMRLKDEGIVKRVAFSFHDKPENLIRLVDLGHFEMVTCQYNYLDRSNEEGIAYAASKGLGVVVMGPVGGGRLAGIPKVVQEKLGLVSRFSAEIPLKFVFSNPNVNIALSGMGSVKMVEENCAVADAGVGLTQVEREELTELMDQSKKLADLYCTGCGYCMPCPNGVNIPRRFEMMNYYRVYGIEDYARSEYAKIRAKEGGSEGKGICTECGTCLDKCPQNIPIIEQLKEVEKTLLSQAKKS